MSAPRKLLHLCGWVVGCLVFAVIAGGFIVHVMNGGLG